MKKKIKLPEKKVVRVEEYDGVSIREIKMKFDEDQAHATLVFFNGNDRTATTQTGFKISQLKEFFKSGDPEENLLKDLQSIGIIPSGEIENR